jgi:hypothetical protein
LESLKLKEPDGLRHTIFRQREIIRERD